MLPFNNKPTREPTWRDLAVQSMRKWRPIGSSFQYLGRECVVTGYYRYVFHEMGTNCLVELTADYADDLGRVHQITFGWAEAKAIMERNP